MSSSRPALAALHVGDRARLVRRFSADDVEAWCALANAPRDDDGVPEPLIAGLFSCLLGEQLPGHGTNYLKQALRFERSAAIGEALTVAVEITAIRADKALVDLATRCTDAEGDTVCCGRALVLFDC